MKWLRAAVSVALLIWVGRAVDWGHLVSLSRTMRGEWILLAAAMAAANGFLTAAKWRVLLRAAGLEFSYRRLLYVIWVSNFLGDFLPASVGGDGLRIAAIARGNSRAPQAASTVVVDRFLGVTSLAVLAVLGGLWASLKWGVGDVLVALTLPVGALLVALTMVWTARGQRALAAILKRLPRLPGRRFVMKLHAAVRSYRHRPKAVLTAAGLSFAIQFSRIVFFVALAWGLRIPLGVVEAAVLMPAINFISMLPITVGGLGLQEGAFVVLMRIVGVEPAAAFALSIATRVVLLAVSSPGLLLFFRHGLGHGARGADPLARPLTVAARRAA